MNCVCYLFNIQYIATWFRLLKKGEVVMKKKALILIVIILLILFSQIDGLEYLISDIMYFAKANEGYVSKEYSLNVENMSRSGKNFAFWGTNENTDNLEYVIFVFRKGIYRIDGNEGVSIDRVREIVCNKGIEPFSISLNVISTFQDGYSIVDYMYWIVEYEYGVLMYISFSDGIEINPFK